MTAYGPEFLEEAKRALQENGYVVLKEKSYRAAQERQRLAKVMQQMAEEDKRSQREWMERDVFPWERHLINRVDHLAGLAVRMGATREDLLGPPCGCGRSGCPDTPREKAPDTSWVKTVEIKDIKQ